MKVESFFILFFSRTFTHKQPLRNVEGLDYLRCFWLWLSVEQIAEKNSCTAKTSTCLLLLFLFFEFQSFSDIFIDPSQWSFAAYGKNRFSINKLLPGSVLSPNVSGDGLDLDNWLYFSLHMRCFHSPDVQQIVQQVRLVRQIALVLVVHENVILVLFYSFLLWLHFLFNHLRYCHFPSLLKNLDCVLPQGVANQTMEVILLLHAELRSLHL